MSPGVAEGAITRDTKATPARFYLAQLDGLRFLAFLLVFLHHGPRLATLTRPGSWAAATLDFLSRFGWCGVDLFLVLSAFLITSLLLIEHDRHGSISLRGFYVRRILRIWPLYYLMTVVGFFLLPWLALFAAPLASPAHAGLVRDHLLAYLTLFGNFSAGLHSYTAASPTIAHLWTVTLEEQFYLVWPVVLALLLPRRRWLWPLLALLLIGTVSLRLGLRTRHPHPYLWTNTATRLDPLIVGIALALWRHRRPATSSALLAAAKLGVGVLLVIAVSWGRPIDQQAPEIAWQFLANAVGFGLILDCSLTRSWNPLVWLVTRRPLVWLGKLTYGLYVYHLLGLHIAAEVVSFLQGRGIATSRAALLLLPPVIGLAVTIAIAAESYRLFEARFLRLKERWSRVKSGAADPASSLARERTSPAPASPVAGGDAVPVEARGPSAASPG